MPLSQQKIGNSGQLPFFPFRTLLTYLVVLYTTVTALPNLAIQILLSKLYNYNQE